MSDALFDGALAALLEEARAIVREVGADDDQLYRRWFHQETGHAVEWPSAGRYRAAVADAARFEPGWAVADAASNLVAGVVAVRRGRTRVVAPPEMVPDDARCLTLRPGVALRVNPLASDQVGGFWHLWSAGWQAAPPRRFGRLYVCITPDRALDFVARVVSDAPPRLTWAMKVLCGAHDSGRRDRALLYVPISTSIETGWVSRLLLAATDMRAEGLPPFVERLAPGLGRAPDPGGGRSFGQAVSGAVASAAAHAGDATRFAAAALAAVQALPGMNRKTPRVLRDH